MSTEKNWAGNYTYRAGRVEVLEPVNPAFPMTGLRDQVLRSKKLRVLGTRHSFNGIADSDGELVSLERHYRMRPPDEKRRVVAVEAGVRYGELGKHLNGSGWALGNMASLPHISVAGAVATGTHGSGVGNGSLATAVMGMELIGGSGKAGIFARESEGEEFNGMVVSLGALGIVSLMTLDIVPAFMVGQEVFEDLPVAKLEGNFLKVMGSGYSVSLFTNWQGDVIEQVWVKRVADGGYVPLKEFFGARRATVERHPIAGISAEHCTPQLGAIGPWHERLPHFRMEFMPSSGAELHSEYFVRAEDAVEAMREIAGLREELGPVLLISEVRTIAADRLWLSPCYGRNSVAFHFTWRQDWPRVERVLRMLEERLARFDARPHWGKLFVMERPRLEMLYERMRDFRRLVRRFDPEGKFWNDFLERNVGRD